MLSGATSNDSDTIGAPLSPWRRGQLDIHHLSTGRGDATVIVSPTGQIALIDAGAVAKHDPAQVPARPNASRTPGEWIARYVRRRLKDTGGSALDAAMVTHLHPDHIGGVAADIELDGTAYIPTGISDVARHVQIGKLLDPDWPDYGYPPFEDRLSAQNYVAFAKRFAADGGRVERLAVGSTGQLLRDGPAFSVRTVAGRGTVWVGRGNDTNSLFLPRRALAANDLPNENAMSSALLVSLGGFRYFLAGDLTDWADAGTRPWLNALTPTAKAVGPVDVAVLPHHGMFDAASSATVAALAARVWVVSAWHAVHPSIDVLERVFSDRLYPGAREVYSTALHPTSELSMHRLTKRFTSSLGHVICRVAPSGASYRMVVTTALSEADTVLASSPSISVRGGVTRG